MKMKKIIGLVLALTLCLASSVTAVAAGLTKDEKAIINKLKSGFEVNNIIVKFPVPYLNQVENEFIRNKTDITPNQAKTIISMFDQAEVIMQKEKITSVSKLKKSKSINQLVSLAKFAASTAGYKVAYNAADCDFSVKNPKDKAVFTTKKVINQTGVDLSNTVLTAGFLVTLLAACAFFTSKMKLFVKAKEV